MKTNNNLDGWAISAELYIWLCKYLPEGKTIIEFGSGTGTKELTKKWKVYSVEHDQKWIGAAPDSNYIWAPLTENGWYDSKKLFNLLPKDYDCIIVDGPIGPNARLGIDKHWDRLRTDIPIIFDDTDRQKDYNHAMAVAKRLGKEAIQYTGKERSNNHGNHHAKKFIVLNQNKWINQ